MSESWLATDSYQINTQHSTASTIVSAAAHGSASQSQAINMHRTKETASRKTTSRTTRPLLAPDVDGRVLEFCGPLELGRCAAVSTGLRAAADLAWKPVATTRFPLLASIARAAGGKFGYASACRSQLKCHKEGVAPPCIREREDLEDWGMNEGDLANIVVTYALHTIRELPRNGTGSVNISFDDYIRLARTAYEDEPPFFVWSGRLSVRTPNLWDQMPTKVREWWETMEPRHNASRWWDHNLSRSRNVYLRIFLTKDSKTILLYDGEASLGRDEVLEFNPKVAPLSPRLADDLNMIEDEPEQVDPREVCLSIRPCMEVATGRFALSPDLQHPPYCPSSSPRVETPADLVLRHIASLNIGAMDAADYWSDYDHAPLWRGGEMW